MSLFCPLHLLHFVIERLDLGLLLFHFGQALVHRPDLGLQFAEFIRSCRRNDQRCDGSDGCPDQKVSGDGINLCRLAPPEQSSAR